MPVAIGIMQHDRLSIRQTTTAMSGFSPSSPATCGATITVNVTVIAASLVDAADVRPSGTVNIINTDDLSVVGSGVLIDDTPTNQSKVTVTLNLTNSSNNLIARYVGVLNSFVTSDSGSSSYSVTIPATAVAFTVPTPSGSNNNVCRSNTIALTARVQLSPPGANITTGIIGFRAYSDETNFITLSTGVGVNGTGNASYTIPANTLTAGTVYGIQARYISADACLANSTSTAGVSGSTTLFNVISGDTGTISITSPTSGSSTCLVNTDPIQFTATISGTTLPAPSVGTVSIYKYGIEFGSGYLLGTATPSSGVATINFTPGTPVYLSFGSQAIKAYYVGDGTCYGNFDNTSQGYTLDGYCYSVNLNTSITYQVYQSLPNNINHNITSDAVYITYTPSTAAPGGFYGYVETIFTNNTTGSQVIYRLDHFTGQSSILIGIANTSFTVGNYSYDGHVYSYDSGHCECITGAGNHSGNIFNVI